MSAGTRKKEPHGSEQFSLLGRGYVLPVPSPSSLRSRYWGHLPARAEAEGAAGCVGGYQGKIIMRLGVCVRSDSTWSQAARSRSSHSTCQLSVTSPTSMSLHPQPTFLDGHSAPGATDKLGTWVCRVEKGPPWFPGDRTCQEKRGKGRCRFPECAHPHSLLPSPFRGIFWKAE